jgi:hypothetical protein
MNNKRKMKKNSKDVNNNRKDNHQIKAYQKEIVFTFFLESP